MAAATRTDSAGEPAPDAAARALGLLTEMSPDMRGGAILDREGRLLASSDGNPTAWEDAAKRLLEAADGAGDESVEQLHIAAEAGEVFGLRHAGLVAIAVTERFALASLMTFDMRAVLRDLAAGAEPRVTGSR